MRCSGAESDQLRAKGTSDGRVDRTVIVVRPGYLDGNWTTASWTDLGRRDKVGGHWPVASLLNAVIGCGLRIGALSEGSEPTPMVLSLRAIEPDASVESNPRTTGWSLRSAHHGFHADQREHALEKFRSCCAQRNTDAPFRWNRGSPMTDLPDRHQRVDITERDHRHLTTVNSLRDSSPEPPDRTVGDRRPDRRRDRDLGLWWVELAGSTLEA